jgi:mRNA-degrading endonuclease RelE of RelBE toxin-antitoxin system
MFHVAYAEGVAGELKALPAAARAWILDSIDDQLVYEPLRQTRNRKMLVGLRPPWQHQEPVWEMRVGPYRVFYDVEEAAKRVTVRCIRRKQPHRTTEETL